MERIDQSADNIQEVQRRQSNRNQPNPFQEETDSFEDTLSDLLNEFIDHGEVKQTTETEEPEEKPVSPLRDNTVGIVKSPDQAAKAEANMESQLRRTGNWKELLKRGLE